MAALLVTARNVAKGSDETKAVPSRCCHHRVRQRGRPVSSQHIPSLAQQGSLPGLSRLALRDRMAATSCHDHVNAERHCPVFQHKQLLDSEDQRPNSAHPDRATETQPTTALLRHIQHALFHDPLLRESYLPSVLFPTLLFKRFSTFPCLSTSCI